jgi:hypothetical protein
VKVQVEGGVVGCERSLRRWVRRGSSVEGSLVEGGKRGVNCEMG